VLAGVALTTGLLWAGGRFLVVRTDPVLSDVSEPGAACATCLVLALTVLVLWVVSAFAALVLVPAVHFWTLATLVDPPPVRRARLVLVGAGLVAPLLVALYYMLALSIDPLAAAWYLLLLVAGGHVGVVTALIGCVLLGVLTAVLSIARRPAEPAEPEGGPRLRGPASYAGPGSLGGTKSALRR
jgi:hypothetical protein